MSSHDPQSWLDRALGAGFVLLVTALSVSWAVHLIEAVWVSLVIILAVGACIIGAAFAVHERRRGW